MTMLTELRKLVGEATPGPWLYDETETPAERIHHPEGFLVARIAKMRTDGRFIAASNPTTILSLLDLVDEMAEALRHYREYGNVLLERRGMATPYENATDALSKYQAMKGE